MSAGDVESGPVVAWSENGGCMSEVHQDNPQDEPHCVLNNIGPNAMDFAIGKSTYLRGAATVSTVINYVRKEWIYTGFSINMLV